MQYGRQVPMRDLIRRLAPIPVMAVAAMIFLTLGVQTSYARSPRVGYVDQLGEIVNADPGEDPHMRIDDPGSEPIPVLDDELSHTPTGKCSIPQSSGASGGGDLSASSRVKTKLLLLFRLAFGAFNY